jgi:Trypsin
MTRFLLLGLLVVASTAGAVVIRDDVPDLRYRVAASEFPALADLPFEGHGVLIAPQWVLTAAHAVTWQSSVDVVVVGGQPRAVARVIVHPGYRKLPQALIDEAMKSDDNAALTRFLASSDDIALIRLAEPVRDVKPVALYEADALGKEIRIIGRGATGKGSDGHHPHGPNRTDLRHGYNRVDSAEGRWIGYTFDAPPAALPLEAAAGNGDSGGPLLVAVDGEWQVAGITSWKRAEGSFHAFRPGKYGQVNHGLRVVHYREWILSTMAVGEAAEASR